MYTISSVLPIKGLESLARPQGEDTRIRSWITARTVAATLRRDAAEAPAGEYAGAVADLRRALAAAQVRARNLARTYGFKVCGSPA